MNINVKKLKLSKSECDQKIYKPINKGDFLLNRVNKEFEFNEFCCGKQNYKKIAINHMKVTNRDLTNLEATNETFLCLKSFLMHGKNNFFRNYSSHICVCCYCCWRKLVLNCAIQTTQTILMVQLQTKSIRIQNILINLKIAGDYFMPCNFNRDIHVYQLIVLEGIAIFSIQSDEINNII